MDPVQPRISLTYTINKEKNLAPKVCSKKNFKSTFRVSSQISVDLYICAQGIDIGDVYEAYTRRANIRDTRPGQHNVR